MQTALSFSDQLRTSSEASKRFRKCPRAREATGLQWYLPLWIGLTKTRKPSRWRASWVSKTCKCMALPPSGNKLWISLNFFRSGNKIWVTASDIPTYGVIDKNLAMHLRECILGSALRWSDYFFKCRKAEHERISLLCSGPLIEQKVDSKKFEAKVFRCCCKLIYSAVSVDFVP